MPLNEVKSQGHHGQPSFFPPRFEHVWLRFPSANQSPHLHGASLRLRAIFGFLTSFLLPLRWNISLLPFYGSPYHFRNYSCSIRVPHCGALWKCLLLNACLLSVPTSYTRIHLPLAFLDPRSFSTVLRLKGSITRGLSSSIPTLVHFLASYH